MQNPNHLPELASNNLFAEQYEAFQGSALFQKLQRKFTPLPYYKKYVVLKWLALAASYLFNIFSALTASTLVYFFVLSLSGTWIIASFITLAFIIIIEIAKRKTNGVFFKDLLQFKKFSFPLLAMVLLLLCISVSFSYYGSKKLVKEFSAPPILIVNDSLTSPISNQIAEIDKQINAARKTTWSGTTTRTSQRTIETLSKQKLALQERLLIIENKTDKKNSYLQGQHASSTLLKSEYFALITLLLELIFILTAFYLEYYDYRSFAEFSKVVILQNQQGDITNKTNANFAYTKPKPKLQNGENGNHKSKRDQKVIVIDNTSKSAIEKAIKQVKGRIASARHRLINNIGRPETSERNIEKFTKELEELKTILNPIQDNT